MNLTGINSHPGLSHLILFLGGEEILNTEVHLLLSLTDCNWPLSHPESLLIIFLGGEELLNTEVHLLPSTSIIN